MTKALLDIPDELHFRIKIRAAKKQMKLYPYMIYLLELGVKK